MKEFCKYLNIESAILEKKLNFWSTRAEWHVTQSENFQTNNVHQACAATLWRDAGAAALILGQIDKAKLHFKRAGDLRIRLGFYDGFYLMRLSGADISHTTNKYREMFKFDEAFMNQTAARSPHQLISIIQAADSHSIFWQNLVEKAESLLEKYGNYLLGVTQTPVAHYVRVLRDLQHDRLREDTYLTLMTMLLQRRKLIMAAQLDRFHWKRVQKPAALIDMDLLACGMVGQNITMHLDKRLFPVDNSDFMPFYAAKLLRAPPEHDVMP